MDDELSKVNEVLGGMRRGKGRRFSRELRAMMVRVAVGLRERGQNWSEIGRAMGVPGETPRRLCVGAGKLKPRRRGGFKPVMVVPDRSAAGTRLRDLVLVSPAGYRVEGLDVEGAADLLRRLR